MDNKIERKIANIETMQGALRENIKRTKELVEDADKLLKRYKAMLKGQGPD